MQVSQQDDFISHAVIGNQETIAMGVSDDAALMHILSSALYTFPQLAVVREVICNGWDAHIAAGKTDTPLQITVTDEKITIRDFGFGIAHTQIGQIYGVYGNSTKRDDSTVTGGFGLGSKAPFAYVDNFEVVSHHLGQKTIYRISKSSMEKFGKPSINKIVALPSQETGIAVTFDLKSASDRSRFERLIREVAVLGDIRVEVNGTEIQRLLPMAESPTGYMITDFSGTIMDEVNLRYGNVVYPIPEHEDYSEYLSIIRRDLRHYCGDMHIIFMATPDSVSIAPNREALILTDKTVEAVKQLLETYDFGAKEYGETAVAEKARAAIKKTYAALKDNEVLTALYKKEFLQPRNLGISHDGCQAFFTARKAVLATKMRKGKELNKREHSRQLLREVLKRNLAAPAMVKKLIRLHSLKQPEHAGYHIFRRILTEYLEYPLRMALEQHAEIAKCKRMVFASNGSYYNYIDRTLSESYANEASFAHFFDKRALITRTSNEAKKYLENRFRRAHAVFQIFLVGSNKNSETNAVLLAETLEKLGYTVDIQVENKVVTPRSRSVAATPRKKKGTYLSLADSYDRVEGNFLLSRARERFTEDSLIESPVAWVILRNKSNSPTSLYQLGEELSYKVVQKWGKQIAVVTELQANALVAQGIPRVTGFLRDQLDQLLSKERDFKRYLAFSYDRDNEDYFQHQILSHMCFHPELMQQLGLRFSVNEEVRDLLKMVYLLDGGFYHLEQCKLLIAQVKRHPKAKEALFRIQTNDVRSLIDLKSLISTLKQDHESCYPYLPAAYKLVQILLK